MGRMVKFWWFTIVKCIFSSAEILPLHGKPGPMAALAYWFTGIKQLTSGAKSFLFTLYVIIECLHFCFKNMMRNIKSPLLQN